MANILSLAVRVTGDASGLQLTPVEKALQRLQAESDKTSAIFEKFAQTSELGAKAQETFNAASSALLETLKAGTITRDEFVRQFAELEAGARETAAALAEGQRVTEANRTEEERRAIAVEKLNQLLAAGGIEQETYNRAVAEASGANAEAARQQAEQEKQLAEAQRARQSLEARAAAIINANLTAQEQYDQKLTEINALQREGLFTQEQYNRAVAAARKPLDDAAAAAERAAQASQNSTLRFNELSGVFAVLPGPIGNIAGRLSGLASASEGISRIISGSGGLAGGISGLAASFTTLLNPLTLALAGIGAIAAAIPAIERFVGASTALGEEASKNAQIFNEYTQQVTEFAKTADVLGISETAALQATGTFGNLFKAIGLGAEQSANWSVELTTLAADLASFNNTSVEDAIQAIGAALRGEAEPIRRYGVLLNDATLKQIAFAQGLIDSEKEALTPAIKAQAAYLAVIEQTTTAQGDVLRTADSLANLQRRVAAQFANLASDAGESFAPLWRAGLELTAAFGSALEQLTRVLSPAISLVGDGLTFVLNGISSALNLIAFAAEKVADLFAFLFPSNAKEVDKTTKSVEQLREELSKPVPDSLLKQTQQEAERTTKLIEKSTQDVGVYGQAAGVAYLKLVASIQSAKDNIDTTTSAGAEQYRREIERANDAYEKQIALIKKANDERANQIKAEQDIIAKLLEQQRINNDFGGDSQRAQSASNADAIANEIQRLNAKLADVVGTSAEDGIRKQIEALKDLRQQELDFASGWTQAREAEYERERERVQKIADARQQAETAAQEKIAQQRKSINEFVNEQLALQQVNGDTQRLQAQRNLAAIEEEMRRVEQDGAEARVRNDQAGLNAAIQRLQQLDQVAAKERDIASGRAAAEEELKKKRDAAIAEQQKQYEAAAKAQEQQAAQAQQAQQKQQEQIQKAFEAQAKENERILQKNRELASASSQAAPGADIRTTEGANAFIQAVQGGFDPQLAVQRQQLKVLGRIDAGLALNLARLGFQTVAFPANAGA